MARWYPTDDAGRQALAAALTASGVVPTQSKSAFGRDKIDAMSEAMSDHTFDWVAASLQPVILGPSGEVLGGHHRVIAAQLAGVDLTAVPGPRPPAPGLPIGCKLPDCPSGVRLDRRPARCIILARRREGAMGFEDFQVVLHGREKGRREAEELIRSLPGVGPDNGFLPAPTYFVMNDGRHSIELEVDDQHGLQISCRFVLSSPPTIDTVFLAFVRELMTRLDLSATAVEGPPTETLRTYSAREFDEWSAATLRHVARRRKEWIADMGTELAATRKELYERIILPRCAPVTKH